MLTDRQDRFYQRMLGLVQSEDLDSMEKHFLRKRIREIEQGYPFGDTINAFCLSMKIHTENTGKPLSADIQKLYNDLIETYGTPNFSRLNNEGKNNSGQIWSGYHPYHSV